MPGTSKKSVLVVQKRKDAFPEIDGWYVTSGGNNFPVSLNEISSDNPNEILKKVYSTNDAGLKYKTSGVIFIADAPKMELSVLKNFAKNGKLTQGALNKGVVDTVITKKNMVMQPIKIG